MPPLAPCPIVMTCEGHKKKIKAKGDCIFGKSKTEKSGDIASDRDCAKTSSAHILHWSHQLGCLSNNSPFVPGPKNWVYNTLHWIVLKWWLTASMTLDRRCIYPFWNVATARKCSDFIMSTFLEKFSSMSVFTQRLWQGCFFKWNHG